SVWTIDVKDQSQNQIILKLSSSDLKSFPSGRQLDITDGQRVYFNRNVEQFTVKKPDEDGIVKIIINYSEKHPIRCGIYLGEKNQQRTDEEIYTRRDTPKPCLESPLIKGDEPGGDEEPENPGRDESDGNGPQKNPGASGSTEGSKKQNTDKQKIQDQIDSVDQSLLFKDVYNNQKNRNELSADLNHDKRWYRVGEKIYRGREDEKDRLPELQDINNELSKQNRAFLEALQKKYGSLTWVEFKRIGIKEHEISELSDVEPRGETIGGFSEDDLDLVSRALPWTAWELYATNTFKDKFKPFEITKIQNAFKEEFKPTSQFVDKINTNIQDYKMVDFLQICATLGYNDVIKKAVQTCTAMGRPRETVVEEQPNLR
uniref:Uncharacterized protein n=1 Tax=Clytia hemisphaerica TaxID=252671 RepID=A0A7M5XMH9_9CNID